MRKRPEITFISNISDSLLVWSSVYDINHQSTVKWHFHQCSCELLVTDMRSMWIYLEPDNLENSAISILKLCKINTVRMITVKAWFLPCVVFVFTPTIFQLCHLVQESVVAAYLAHIWFKKDIYLFCIHIVPLQMQLNILSHFSITPCFGRTQPPSHQHKDVLSNKIQHRQICPQINILQWIAEDYNKKRHKMI
jgi:hypothetical protein